MGCHAWRRQLPFHVERNNAHLVHQIFQDPSEAGEHYSIARYPKISNLSQNIKGILHVYHRLLISAKKENALLVIQDAAHSLINLQKRGLQFYTPFLYKPTVQVLQNLLYIHFIYSKNDCSLFSDFMEAKTAVPRVTPNNIKTMLLNHMWPLACHLRDLKSTWDNRLRRRKSHLTVRIPLPFQWDWWQVRMFKGPIEVDTVPRAQLGSQDRLCRASAIWQVGMNC